MIFLELDLIITNILVKIQNIIWKLVFATHKNCVPEINIILALLSLKTNKCFTELWKIANGLKKARYQQRYYHYTKYCQCRDKWTNSFIQRFKINKIVRENRIFKYENLCNVVLLMSRNNQFCFEFSLI